MSKTTKAIESKCRICGASSSTFLLEKKRGIFKSAWVQCEQCKSAHIHPYPSDEDLAQYYNSDYIEMELSDGSDEGVNHKLRFSDEYRASVFNEYSFSLIDAGFGTNEFEKIGNVLDYGCANGFFLDYLLSKGVGRENLNGFDIGADMIDMAKNKGYNCTANPEELTRNHYDFITLWDVIEHVPHPKVVVKELKNLLKPGGG